MLCGIEGVRIYDEVMSYEWLVEITNHSLNYRSHIVVSCILPGGPALREYVRMWLRSGRNPYEEVVFHIIDSRITSDS